MVWEEFIKFLKEERDCKLVDDTDWAYPVYKVKGSNKYVGLDLSADLDDFLICSICLKLDIDPPEGHDQTLMELVRSISNGFLRGVPPASSN